MKKSMIIFLVILLLALVGLVVFLLLDSDQEEVIQEDNDAGLIEQEETEQQEFEEVLDDVLGADANPPSEEFIQCLVDSGMVVYASKTCPACTDLANKFGGYDSVEDLFILCGDDSEICSENIETGFVPEIQYNGEVFGEGRNMEDFANLTGCEL